MKVSTIRLAYFSATYTTKVVAKLVAEQICDRITEHDITQTTLADEVICESEEVLILAAPVYAGRIPAKAANEFNRFKGKQTPAILLCVYGNRDYDDALVEMKDLVERNGFKVISAGAFIAQHSIFPEVGSNRPDDTDRSVIRKFALQSADMLAEWTDISRLPAISVKGNRPYKTPKSIPLKPKGNKNCDQCGRCVKLCPTQAIPEDSPRKTDRTKCISCGRCIVVCHNNARHFGGILYKLVASKFKKANALRKEPETFYAV